MKCLIVQRLMICGLAAALAAPGSMAYGGQSAEPAPQQQVSPSSDSQQQTAPLETRPQNNQDQPATEAQQGAQQQGGQAPVGAAAAPYEKASGTTATRPAGAVIAPAKQRRVRQIFIKVGILAGAGAAIAAVALLSHSSPSTPR